MSENKVTKKKSKALSFKEKPLVRSGNTIYYGEPAERFLTKLDILKEDKFGSETVPSAISVELLDMLELESPKVIMKSERETLYDALEIGYIWIERASDAV